MVSEMLVLCIRALVPTLHTANTVGKRSSSKYKVGQEVTGRILDVDAAKKRVSMTLKKLLCSDKLPVITTFQVSFCGCHALVNIVKSFRSSVRPLRGWPVCTAPLLTVALSSGIAHPQMRQKQGEK